MKPKKKDFHFKKHTHMHIRTQTHAHNLIT